MNNSATAISPNANASGANAGNARKSRRPFFLRVPFLILGSLVLLLIGFLYFQSTVVSGKEISTNTWDVRNFSFRRDPFTNYQFTGVKHSAPKRLGFWTEITTYSMVDNSIKIHLKSKRPKNRWDLISFDQSLYPADAQVLIDLLTARNASYDYYWSKWSGNNPVKAAKLWPAAQDLVHLGLYSKLPPLFEIGTVTLSDNAFTSEVDSYMAQTLGSMAAELAQLGEHERSRSLAEVGSNYGSNEELEEVLNSVQAEIETFD